MTAIFTFSYVKLLLQKLEAEAGRFSNQSSFLMLMSAT